MQMAGSIFKCIRHNIEYRQYEYGKDQTHYTSCPACTAEELSLQKEYAQQLKEHRDILLAAIDLKLQFEVSR